MVSIVILIPFVILAFAAISIVAVLVSKNRMTSEEKRRQSNDTSCLLLFNFVCNFNDDDWRKRCCFYGNCRYHLPTYQTFNEYKEMREMRDSKFNDKGELIQKPEFNNEELLAEYALMQQQEKERTRNRAFNSLIKSFGWIVIPLPIFIYYQRRIRHHE